MPVTLPGIVSGATIIVLLPVVLLVVPGADAPLVAGCDVDVAGGGLGVFPPAFLITSGAVTADAVFPDVVVAVHGAAGRDPWGTGCSGGPKKDGPRTGQSASSMTVPARRLPFPPAHPDATDALSL